MIKKFTLAFCALFLLAGCSSSAKQGSPVSPVSQVSENNKNMDFENQVGTKVFFSYNSSSLSHEAQGTLKNQATWLTAHPAFSVVVEGHCDERGTREYNIALGERRANAVKHFLTHNGVDKARVETISYGKERPAVVGDNEAAWSQNRRGVTAIK